MPWGMNMRKIFALVIMGVLLAVMTISQAQTADWKTYNDPQGRFSMKYPSNWEGEYEVSDGEGEVEFDAPSDIDCEVVVQKRSLCRKIGNDMTFREGDETERIVIIYGEKYELRFEFEAPSEYFEYANKTYFEPMIESAKVK
ncbi:MAG: hypothetical protein MOIL_00924 [Candidatus Methanolliviera sp. GoM_oil]|nr:MAG: hypothetical protein MOIL_00924 [Candidatus Methanolliviera sp. GoM_oil]